MSEWLVGFPLRLLRLALAIVGAFALLLAAMVATPLAPPPELKSISQTARAVDRSTMPVLERFSARDGTQLAYRYYPARGQAAGRVAILVHGSSGSSAAAHALADALAAHGVETFALVAGAVFLLWMAAVNGGGLILSGFWMRWGE